MNTEDSRVAGGSCFSSPTFRLAGRWGPVLVWMAGIFYFSSLPDPLGPLSRLELSDAIGSLAHFAEYVGLAVLLYRAFTRGEQGERAFLVSFFVLVAYAVLDELHQMLVPGRRFEMADIGFDLAGGTVGFGLVRLRELRRHNQHT